MTILTIEFEIVRLGPVENTSLTIKMPSISVFYGSNISGKSLVGTSLAAALLAYAVTTQYQRLARLVGCKSEMLSLASELIPKEVEPLNLEELEENQPVRIFKDAWPDVELTEAYRRYIGLRVIEEGLRSVFVLEQPLDFETCLKVDGTDVLYVKCQYPITKVREKLGEVLVDKLRDCLFEVRDGSKPLMGLALLDPYNEPQAMLNVDGISTIFTRLVKTLLVGKPLPPLLLSDKVTIFHSVLREFCNALAKSLSLSGLSLEDKDVEIRSLGEDLLLRLGSLEIPFSSFSKGLRSLIATIFYAAAALTLSKEFYTVLYLDEPEASLDTLMSYHLPRALLKLLEAKYLAIIVSTHRDEIIVSLEKLLEANRVSIDEVNIYEMRFNAETRFFKPVLVEFDEVLKRFKIIRLQRLEGEFIGETLTESVGAS